MISRNCSTISLNDSSSSILFSTWRICDQDRVGLPDGFVAAELAGRRIGQAQPPAFRSRSSNSGNIFSAICRNGSPIWSFRRYSNSGVSTAVVDQFLADVVERGGQAFGFAGRLLAIGHRLAATTTAGRRQAAGGPSGRAASSPGSAPVDRPACDVARFAPGPFQRRLGGRLIARFAQAAEFGAGVFAVGGLAAGASAKTALPGLTAQQSGLRLRLPPCGDEALAGVRSSRANRSRDVVTS